MHGFIISYQLTPTLFHQNPYCFPLLYCFKSNPRWLYDFISIWCVSLKWGPTSFYCEVPESKYFWLRTQGTCEGKTKLSCSPTKGPRREAGKPMQMTMHQDCFIDGYCSLNLTGFMCHEMMFFWCFFKRYKWNYKQNRNRCIIRKAFCHMKHVFLIIIRYSHTYI